MCSSWYCYCLIDSEAPILTCVEDKATGTDEGKPTARVTWDNPHAADNSGEVTVTCDSPSGTDFDIGQTTVTCNAVDGSGNKKTCNFQIDVRGI